MSGADRDAFRFLARFDRRSLRLAGTAGSVRRDVALRAELALFGLEGRRRPSGQAYHHTYGLPVLTTNCSNNYGPYQFPEKLIPLMILNAVEGKPLPVYGDGQNVRDWLFVEDHCRALRLVLEKGTPGEVYNIGGRCERTNLDVVRTIAGDRRSVCGRTCRTPLLEPHQVRRRSSRPRSALCDRLAENRARVGLAAAAAIRIGT